MYTIFSAVQRQQRKSDAMASFGLTACSAVYYQVPHCRFIIWLQKSTPYLSDVYSVTATAFGSSTFPPTSSPPIQRLRHYTLPMMS
jgi:hypothetical protein